MQGHDEHRKKEKSFEKSKVEMQARALGVGETLE
jgi:hypothetical protein